jgi:ATP adenylyltransferase/5',5'''-P-1,P-4-tetraphosphate phosphorylase II
VNSKKNGIIHNGTTLMDPTTRFLSVAVLEVLGAFSFFKSGRYAGISRRWSHAGHISLCMLEQRGQNTLLQAEQ